MQLNRFESGGFVIHKLTVGGVQYSAWFSAGGELLDAERKAPNGLYTVSVPRKAVRVRAELERVGRRFVLATAE